MFETSAFRSRTVHDPEAGRLREARPVGVAVALLIIGVGIAALVGNIADIRLLTAPSSRWPAMPPLPAVELVLVGFAFLALVRADRRIALPAAALAATVGLFCIIGALGAYALPIGGMALSTALLHTTIAFAMVVATASTSPRDEERALGVAGFVVITLVLATIGATLTGVIDPLSDARVAGASVQTLICTLVLGVYLLAVMWLSGRVTVESADWLPAGVGFASMLTVLVLWRALSFRETDQLRTLTEQAGDAQLRAMEQSVQGLASALARSAARRAACATPDQQERDLQSLHRDISGLEDGVFFSKDSGQLVLAATDTVLPGLDSLWRARVMRDGPLSDSVRFWPLDAAARRFAVVAPACTGNAMCEGAVVGVVRTDELFQGLLNDTTLGFFHGLGTTDGRRVPQLPIAGRGARALVALPLRMGDVELQLNTWPTPTTVARVRSELPVVVLTMGTLLSILLVLTTTMGQSARSLARTRERARLASVLERSTDGIWEWDLVSGAADHSLGIWHNLGYEQSIAHATREAWMGLVHPDDVEGFKRALERHLSGEAEAFEFEYRVRNHSGDWHTMVDRARVVERTSGGQPLRLLGVRADVTEARNAHAARILNERRFRAIFDSGFQFQLLLDREGQVLEVNRVALEAGNATVEQVVGQPVWNTLWWSRAEDARAPLQAAFQNARAGKASRYESEVSANGAPATTLEVAIKPFIDRVGETNQLLLEARDITVKRRAEAALQEVDTLTTMGRVAARVAHEINNPLAGIQNSFLLIKGAISPTHPHFSYVGAIEREIDRIAAVTRQLYETYRPEQDLASGTSVRSLVTDAVSFLTQVNRHTHVRIETDFVNVPSVIRLPSAMLRQIFINLAQNAFEASPPGELVSIRAEVQGATLVLSVRDRGVGIPPELRDRIFDPFFSTKDRGVRAGGMGLGLALVRRTVAAAGGTIGVADAPGAGTTFTVTLPVPPGTQGENA